MALMRFCHLSGADDPRAGGHLSGQAIPADVDSGARGTLCPNAPGIMDEEGNVEDVGATSYNLQIFSKGRHRLPEKRADLFK